MDFITGVNRLLRIEHIIFGGDDDITTFSDTQHSADISLAKIAVQDELTELVSDHLIPYEHTTDTITLLTSQRSYALNTNFIRFYGTPSFYDSVDNNRIYMFAGGEKSLMNVDYLYKVTTGSPINFYWDDATSKKVAFYNIPSSAYNNRSLTYDYEKSVLVTNSTDTLPFHNTEEANSFISMAARRFRFMRTEKELGKLMTDSTYTNAKSRLLNLIRPSNPSMRYGNRYR